MGKSFARARLCRKMVRLFEQWSNELIDWGLEDGREILETETAQFYLYEGKMVSEQPVSQFLWSSYFDAIPPQGAAVSVPAPDGWQRFPRFMDLRQTRGPT